MPTLEDLYLKGGDVISEDWYRYHYEVHKALDELLLGVTTVISYGYVYGHLIPYADSALDIGHPDRRFRDLFAFRGYFDDNVWVRGKRVLKDEDPIYIADLYYQATSKVTYAIDQSYYVQLVLSANRKLADIILELEAIKSRVKQVYERLYQEIDVDILARESTASDLLRGVATDGEQIILKPSYGKRISTRSWHLQTSSTGGLITLIFPESGKYIGVLMCARGFWAGHGACNVYGYVNEPVKIKWEGLSPSPDIFWQITYKEI